MEIIVALLIAILGALIFIAGLLSAILLKMEQVVFDPMKPVNQYGEGLSDAIQNSIARGQRGINTWE